MSGSWAGKRVLITGHMGFKGGWLSLWLARLGAQVSGFSDRPPSKPSLFETARIERAVNSSVVGDVRDLAAVCRVVRETKPDVIFHMAAQSLVRESYRRPVETFASNVMGTVNLLDAVRQRDGACAVVVVTSDKCYENREWHWGYRESDPVGGYDPYSASKGAAEVVTAAYRRSFFPPERYSKHGVAVATVRAGNVIGGGDWGAEKLIPDIVRAFALNETVFIRNPTAVRPWQHVLDALHGYMLLAERLCADPGAAEAWNFGPSDSDTRSVQWIVEQMAKLWGEGAAWSTDDAPAPHEATLLKLDSSKARNVLGWVPRLDLATALAWTVRWYREHSKAAEMQALTAAQIDEFNALAVHE